MNTEISNKENSNSVKSTLIKNISNKISKKSYIETEQFINILNYKKITTFINVILCGIYSLNENSMKNNESFINFMTSRDKDIIAERRKTELALYSNVIQKYILHSENINKPLKEDETPKAIMDDGQNIYGTDYNVIIPSKLNKYLYIPVPYTNIKPQSVITKDVSHSILYSSLVDAFSSIWEKILISYNYLKDNSNISKIKNILNILSNSEYNKYVDQIVFDEYIKKLTDIEIEKKNKENNTIKSKPKSKRTKKDKVENVENVETIENIESVDVEKNNNKVEINNNEIVTVEKNKSPEKQNKNISFKFNQHEIVTKDVERINIKNKVIAFNKKVIDFCKEFITEKVKENKIDISSFFIENPTKEQKDSYNFTKFTISFSAEDKDNVINKFDVEYKNILKEAINLGKEETVNDIEFNISNTFFKNYIKQPSLNILNEKTNNSSIVNKINYNFTILNEIIFKCAIDKYVENINKYLIIKSKKNVYKKMIEAGIIYNITLPKITSENKNDVVIIDDEIEIEEIKESEAQEEKIEEDDF